jgi:radical SAM superfamily enzyme YgiQ (UPF0313 family)
VWSPALRALRGFSLPARAQQRPDAQVPPSRPGMRTLRVYFIKPSKYDDDGLVVSYRWGVIPNNTLTVLAAMNERYAASHRETCLQTVLWDEMVDGILCRETIESIVTRAAADGVELIIGLAGVQTNQYPRARDIGLQFKQRGAPVLMGGFHVSGHEPTCEFLTAVGITVVIGEAENTWPVMLDDYLRAALKPRYSVSTGIRAKTGLHDITVPVIREAELPAIDPRYLTRFFNPTLTTIETSRGCPFACSYCAVKNVIGRTMRPRDPRLVIEWIRDAHDRHGIRSLFIVDDDFYRSPHWEDVLTGMAELRRGGRDIWFMMQADVESGVYARPVSGEQETQRQSRSRRFVDLAAAAGCYSVFMGFESFNPANLEQAMKFQNEDREDRHKSAGRLEDIAARVKARYQRAVDNWHHAGIGVHCGYIIGFPFDQKGCGKQAAQDLTDIGVDIASFFAYTLLPGTEDYVKAVAEDTVADDDFDHYDGRHFVARHPNLSPDELEQEYRAAYRTFYTWRRLAWSLATLHKVPGLNVASRLGMLTQQIYFTYSDRRGWHPMMGGIWRRRNAVARRQVQRDAEAASRYLGVVAVEKKSTDVTDDTDERTAISLATSFAKAHQQREVLP